MHITDASLKRIENWQTSGSAISSMFKILERAAIDTNAVGAVVTLDYQHPDDEVQPGDMIPTITLSLRPATLPE